MAGWENDKLSRTLIIQKHPVAGNRVKFALHPFTRVTTPEGTTYLEPLPQSPIGLTDDWLFDKIEYMEGSGGVDRDGSSPPMGDSGLTNDNNRSVRRASLVVG